MNRITYLLKNQWPFWLGGFFVGLSEIIYYFRYDSFIVVTTGLAQMYAVSEEYLFGINWVAQLYEPGIHWVIIGAVLGARLVVIVEGESRAWVHYHWRILLLAFIGGMMFSFGTRIAGGCTTHHFMGGLPAMSIASWVVLLTGIPFAFLAFKIALVFDMGGHFRHQDTHATARKYCDHPDHPHPGYKPEYKPWRNPLHIGLTLFLLVFMLVPLYFAFFTEEIIGAVADIGWEEVTWLMVVGLILGFGIGKCGFGTECSVMAPESIFTNKEFYRKGGVPMATYTMFRGMLPLQGFMVAIVMFNLFILAFWMLDMGSIPNASGDEGLYWGHILGGPLLAMGAIFMIGCEVRTYARLGMGYATALAALPGFYVGYLPYTFFSEQIDAVVFGEGLTEFITLPEWASYTLGGSEYAWAILYSLLLIGILIFSFEYGRRFLKTSMRHILTHNTDQLVYEAYEELTPSSAK
ncbi:MAG: YeeE/YedE family protein [Thiomargarita sp.]|nr:YeeE/YedE family protein [Thiomargarita sp.]